MGLDAHPPPERSAAAQGRRTAAFGMRALGRRFSVTSRDATSTYSVHISSFPTPSPRGIASGSAFQFVSNSIEFRLRLSDRFYFVAWLETHGRDGEVGGEKLRS